MNAAKLIVGAVLAAAVCGCASTADVTSDAPFDPAACYDRDVDIYFDGREVELSREARGVIDVVAGQLRGCRIDQARIIGLAEATGPEEVNEVLSAERAREIADYLVSHHHWPRERIEVRAAGERGAITELGPAPMRRRGRLIVEASAPEPN